MEVFQKNLLITILAGGEGKRMNSTLPKVLVEFNKKPMLIGILEQCLKLNPNKIVVVTGKYHAQIVNKVNAYFIDMIDNINLIFIKQPCQKGTGNAVVCCLDTYSCDDNVLIINGDTPNLKFEILQHFIRQLYLKDCANGLMTCEYDDPTGYGRIITDNDNMVEKIVEEKDATEEEKKIKLINTGIYFINGLSLKELIPLIEDNNVQNEYYLTDLIALCYQYKNQQIYNMILSKENIKYVLGVNTQKQLEDLENTLSC
jgi:UDP-N-acetylglucosamine diphosphorylase/glucosamine-1-phosphate N-acetyltransferase